MAKKAYGGVSDVAQNGIKIYGGVNDVAQKIVKGYCGVSNVSQQFWPAGEDTQPVLKPAVNWIAGGTYDLDTCPAIMGLLCALHLAKKIFKPLFVRHNGYQNYAIMRREILSYFYSIQGDANTVYVSAAGNNTNGIPKFVVTVYLGTVNNLQRTITAIDENRQYGSKIGTIANVTTTREFTYILNLNTGEITRTDLTISTSWNWVGLKFTGGRFDYTMGMQITNLGMTMYNISMIYDWYWNFNGPTGMADQVDGFMAYKTNTTSGDDTQDAIIDGDRDFLQLPAFLWQTGRNIRIKIGNFERHYTGTTSRSYSSGDFFGVYNGAAGQYSVHGDLLNFQSWNTTSQSPPTVRTLSIYDTSYSEVNLDDVNEFNGETLILDFPATGGWTVNSARKYYGGIANTFFMNFASLAMRFGRVRTGSYDYATYTFEVESIAVQ